MTDTDRMVVWLRETLDAAQQAARALQAATGDTHCDGADQGTIAGKTLRYFLRFSGPAAVLRRIAADRQLLDDLIAEQHNVVEDPAYTCPAATTERDGGRNYHPGPCDCGRDERVQRRVRLLAEGYGWTEETT